MIVENRKKYYSNGSIKQITPLINGIIDGVVTTFYQNGAKKVEVEYLNGKISGKVKTYYEDGSLESVESYSNGSRNNDLIVYSGYGDISYSHNIDDISMCPCKHLGR